ncbi:hypothetical protein M885DRAFT_569334 [Pelagophyceae sp. CCMP2097]|nr:hypothetical protein M885DRAFT_569334 [Pelagophyceae sp. CCMP2097]
MDDPPAASSREPCCVCDAPDGKHCTKCKSHHYCGKACQILKIKVIARRIRRYSDLEIVKRTFDP